MMLFEIEYRANSYNVWKSAYACGGENCQMMCKCAYPHGSTDSVSVFACGDIIWLPFYDSLLSYFVLNVLWATDNQPCSNQQQKVCSKHPFSLRRI